MQAWGRSRTQAGAADRAAGRACKVVGRKGVQELGPRVAARVADVGERRAQGTRVAGVARGRVVQSRRRGLRWRVRPQATRM